MPRTRDEKLLVALGARLQAIRKTRGLTQEALAEAMQIQPVTLSRLETGQRALSLSTLSMAADALECSLGDLCGVETELPTPTRPAAEGELLRIWRSLGEGDQGLALRLVREVGRNR